MMPSTSNKHASALEKTSAYRCFDHIASNATRIEIIYLQKSESVLILAGSTGGEPDLIVWGASASSKFVYVVIGGASSGSMADLSNLWRLLAIVALAGINLAFLDWIPGTGVRVASAQITNGDFSGGATGWTTSTPADGTVTYTGGQLTANSDDNGGAANSRTTGNQSVTTTEPGVLGFQLVNYTTTDIDFYDYPTVLIGGTYYWITTGGALTTTAASGIDNSDAPVGVTGSAGLPSGTTTIGFGVTATDNCCGRGTAVWDNITYQELAQSPGAQTVDEDATLTFSGGSALAVASNATGTMTVTLTVTNGIVTLGTTAGITITGGGNGTSTVTFTGTQAQINTALAGTTYDPTADYNGAATLTFSSTFDGQTDTDTINITVNPVPDYAFTIGKVADRSTVTAAGQTTVYTITVENTGDTDLTGATIADNLVQDGTTYPLTVTGPTGDGGTIGTMEPGEIWTYTASHVMTAAQLSNENDLVNTATFNPAEIAAQDSNTTTVSIPLPIITLQKVVINSSGVPGDWTLTYNGPATGTGVHGSVAVTNVTVPIGTYALSETNVSAAANYALANLVCSGSADTATTVLNPNITLTYGENVTCVFSNRRFRTITLLKDVVGGPATDTDWTLRAISTAVSRIGVEGSTTVTAVGAQNQPLTLSEINGPSGYILTGLGCVGTADTATTVANPVISVLSGEAAFCTFTNTFDGSFTIAKSVDVTNATTTGTLTYTITVTNTGTADLTGPNLTDSIEQDGTPLTLASGPTLTSGDADLDNELDVGEVWIYSATYALTQTNLDDGNDIINTATFSTTYVSAQSDTATTTIAANPSLSVTKIATYGGGPTTANGTTDNLPVGEVITYTYVITNDGNQTISEISLADVHNGSGTAPAPDTDSAILTDNGTLLDSSNPSTGDSDWDILAPGDVLTLTQTYTVTQNDVDTLQ